MGGVWYYTSMNRRSFLKRSLFAACVGAGIALGQHRPMEPEQPRGLSNDEFVELVIQDLKRNTVLAMQRALTT